MLLKTEAHLWLAAAYIAANPVEAGACGRAEDWPWSSHAAVAGRAQPAWLDHARLLAHFGAAGGDPRRRYLDAVVQRCGSNRLGETVR